ncbi:hypothetical protein IEQ34_004033 [Dendrobium chrysotoxum]|uniref:Uncharacterized protein n=1 Tax=Dendrobium chrysotoxum TaxID=161865 RepID=A0AAV7HF97_DENCH|nr:hypothetical protein IEQ34_004033 [Dendrobium chrysotoxum]
MTKFLAKLPTITDAKPEPLLENSFSRSLSENPCESEAEPIPRMIPTVSASDTLEIELDNSSDLAILATCLRLVGISSESDCKKRLRSQDTTLTASAAEEMASAIETRSLTNLTRFRRLEETEGRW